jgi:hypothetical protein
MPDIFVTDENGISAFRIRDDNKVFDTRTGKHIGHFINDRMIGFDGKDLGGLKGPSIPVEKLDASNNE